METINGEWYMKGIDRRHPDCLHAPEALAELVRQTGFLALFANEIPGFSVEERTESGCWWTGDPASDPWEWRIALAENEQIAYGKFFDGKAGFVSKEWFPAFANYRRDGYDFDALYEDGFASRRAKKLMDALETDEQMRGRSLMTNELKRLAGFGEGGEKNFAGVLTDLQMRIYLIMGAFRQRKNRRGEPYGWHIACMETPETKWGCEFIGAGYAEPPEASGERIFRQVREHFPAAEGAALRRLLGFRGRT